MKFGDFVTRDINEGIKDTVKDAAIKVGRKLGVKKAQNTQTSGEKKKKYEAALNDLKMFITDITGDKIESGDVKTKMTDTGMTAIIAYDHTGEDNEDKNRSRKLSKEMKKIYSWVQEDHDCSAWVTKYWFHNGTRYMAVAFS